MLILKKEDQKREITKNNHTLLECLLLLESRLWEKKDFVSEY